MIRTFPFLVSLAAAIAGQLSAQGDQLDSSPALFSVMAAVHAAAPDNAVPSGLAGQIRAQIIAKNPPVLSDLRSWLQARVRYDRSPDLGAFISFALLADEPPTFKPRLLAGEMPPDVQSLEGFRELLVRFHQEADIDSLWRKMQPAYEKEIERYHEPVSRAVLEVNSYLRNPTSGYMGRRFQIYVDLLAPSHQVHTRSFKDEYFIVVTPAADMRIDDVRHGYLHFVLDPLATKYYERVMRVRGLGDFARAAPALGEIYKEDFLLLATESLIKAVEARISRRPELVQRSLAEGYVLAPYFFEMLPVYEKQEAAMRLYFPEMLDRIDAGKEDRRLQQVQFAPAVAGSPSPVAIADSAPPVSPIRRELDEADKLYAARDLDKAREAYLKIASQTDDKELHARAYYGLARVAALRNEAELAEQLFRKTLELTPDPHTRSWTEVFLGRLAEGFGETGQALAHYKAALGVEGAPPGARQAAELGAGKLSPK